MKSKLMRAATLLMVLTLMTSCFVGSTFAKYTSTATASDTATVAQWSIEYNDTQIATTEAPTITFNLFDTVYEADTTTAEEHVSNNLIAPGTGGSFAMTIENLSEVDAKYSITMTETATIAPLQFTLDPSSEDNWKENLADLNMSEVAIAKLSGSATHTVYWRWRFEVSDSQNTADTALGIAARGSSDEIQVSATITVTQVD